MSTSEPASIPVPLLADGALRLGFSLTPRQLEQFQLYYATLVDWNTRINLTAITDYEGVQLRHFLDSLTVAAALLPDLRNNEPPPNFSLIDIGTGAGFPGLPIKILWPQIRLVLTDSIGKKTTFLSEVAKLLDLDNVEVVTARAEELGQNKTHRERHDAVTARAVASLPVLCEYCLPLAKPGGWMLAPKKGDISQELQEAKKASPILGGSPPQQRAFTLPTESEERYVVLIKKLKPTPSGYPRRVGLAKSHPLGT
jgi:16S rRNA (guanine527-N7)-methyltransferase